VLPLFGAGAALFAVLAKGARPRGASRPLDLEHLLLLSRKARRSDYHRSRGLTFEVPRDSDKNRSPTLTHRGLGTRKIKTETLRHPAKAPYLIPAETHADTSARTPGLLSISCAEPLVTSPALIDSIDFIGAMEIWILLASEPPDRIRLPVPEFPRSLSRLKEMVYYRPRFSFLRSPTGRSATRQCLRCLCRRIE
jgi:hypothetical protein